MNYQEFLETIYDKQFVIDLLNSLDKKPLSGARLNTLKYNGLNPLEHLTKHPFVRNGFIYDKEKEKLSQSPYFDLGLFYIQEPSAMMVSELLDVKPDDFVIDLCAAPGGKSTHVASFLGENGLLVSNDINSQRCLDLSENIQKAGIKNCYVTNESVDKLVSSFGAIFDKVVLDAPCSGEGMFRKNKEAEKDWSKEKVERLSELQKDLIIKAYKLLKPNGVMIYSTCTFNNLENEEVVKYLLDNTNASLIKIKEMPNVDRGLDMVEAIHLFPNHFQGEGHFMALIRCNDEWPKYARYKVKNIINNKDIIPFLEFEKVALNITFPRDHIINNNNHLYCLPSNILDMTGIRVLRFGLYLGELKGKHFVPSHDLALATAPKDWKKVIEIDENDYNAYKKGLSLSTDTSNGYALLSYNNYGCGLGKVVNGVVKNHYPKQLRR